MERNIIINVLNKVAYADKAALIVCNNADYTATFVFDDEWDGILTKTARFYANKSYTDVVFTGNTVAIPPILNATNVRIGVFAGDMTTTPALVRCEKSILCEGGTVKDPPNDVYEQIMTMLNELAENGVTSDQIAVAVERYLTENPVQPGATREQAEQIAQNTQDIADLKESGGAAGSNGEDGATFTPSVDNNGNLSWTNDKGLANPPSVNIKGATGASGATGAAGDSITNVMIDGTGHLIVTLSSGKTIDAGLVSSGSGSSSGGSGADGVGIRSIEKTGTIGLVDTYTVTLTNGGTYSFTVTNGANGDDGVSCTHSWNGTTLTVTSASGTSSADLKGEKGDTGHTPVKGTDYFTDADKQEIIDELNNRTDEVQWFNLPYNSTDVTYPTDVGAVYTKVNNIVSIQGSLKLVNTLAKDATVQVATLPAGYRPKKPVYTMRCIGGSWYRLNVNTEGAMSISNFQSTTMSNNYGFYVNIEYVVGN